MCIFCFFIIPKKNLKNNKKNLELTKILVIFASIINQSKKMNIHHQEFITQKKKKLTFNRKIGLFFGLIMSVILILFAFFGLNFIQFSFYNLLSYEQITDKEQQSIKILSSEIIQIPDIDKKFNDKKLEKFVYKTNEKQIKIEKIIQKKDSIILEEEEEEYDIIGHRYPAEIREEAEFIGGEREFYKFISENIKYPKTARKQGIEITIFVEFTIQKDGQLVDIKIKNPTSDVDGGCNEEVIRVLKLSPKWNPAKLRGKNQKRRIGIPIKFELK